VKSRAWLVGLVMITAGCSKHEKAAEPQQPAAETLKSPQGVSYLVSRVPGIKASDLPMNADFKMADRDLGKYAQTLCTLDVPPNTAPSRCDMYVQSDPSGTLIGYATITQDYQGVNFATVTTLNEKKEPGDKACYLGGKLLGSEMSKTKTITDASKDFDAEFDYTAWQKEPGNYLVSPTDENASADMDADTANGVWYVKKEGDKLRISQERWNYCYTDSSVNVDDVFYRVMTLIKQAKPQAGAAR
jgi:hypothetical protein